ncbi:hypothetical protein [Micromonospora chersina]|uniref:hypothetical protein n=1 Tax=Micromonospora chersina TaxID=47854 RepID=UPI003F4D6446
MICWDEPTDREAARPLRTWVAVAAVARARAGPGTVAACLAGTAFARVPAAFVAGAAFAVFLAGAAFARTPAAFVAGAAFAVFLAGAFFAGAVFAVFLAGAAFARAVVVFFAGAAFARAAVVFFAGAALARAPAAFFAGAAFARAPVAFADGAALARDGAVRRAAVVFFAAAVFFVADGRPAGPVLFRAAPPCSDRSFRTRVFTRSGLRMAESPETPRRRNWPRMSSTFIREISDSETPGVFAVWLPGWRLVLVAVVPRLELLR